MIVPGHILRIIGDAVQIRATMGAYFFSISTWIAIVSKKRLYRDISVLPIDMDVDVVLLVLSMKLVNEKLPARPEQRRTGLYAMTKEFYSMVESSGIDDSTVAGGHIDCGI